MRKNKEHKVGDIINVTLEIKEQENINDGCKGCFFDYYGLKCGRPLHYESCIDRERSDGKHIIFVEK